MAYTTGTAIGGLGILGVLNTFLTGSAGWLLHDSLGAHDKIYRSTGTGLKQNHYIRVTATTKTFVLAAGTGTFVVGETVTGSISGAASVVVAVAGTPGTTPTLVLTDITGVFQVETFTGVTSGATGKTTRTVSLTSGTGTFAAGNTITGGTSGGSALIVSVTGSPGTTPVLVISNIVTGLGGVATAFTDTLTDGTSAATGVFTGALFNLHAFGLFGPATYPQGNYTTRSMALTGATGTFVAGETISGNTSGAFAQLISVTGSPGATPTLTITVTQGTFASGETVKSTGGATGATTASSGVPTVSNHKDPRDAQNAYDWLLFRAYSFWNATLHVGTNEVAKWGPQFVSTPGNSFSTFQNARVDNLTDLSNPKVGYTSTSASYLAMWDGVRKFYGFPAASLGNAWDYPLASSTAISMSGNVGPGGSGQSSGIQVHDRTNDRNFIYAEQAAGGVTAWRRWNSDTNVWDTLSTSGSPALGNTGSNIPQGLRYAWDGNDFVYVAGNVNSGTPGFGRYKISTNNWTTLAVSRTLMANNSFGAQNVQQEGVYLPRGTVSGINEDVILFLVTPATTLLDRYNVQSNTWTTLALPESGAVSTANASAQIWYDQGRNRVYYAPNNTSEGFAYEMDLGVAGLTFTGARVIQHLTTGALAPVNSHAMTMDHFPCKLKCKAGDTTTYYIAGDADNVAIATKLTASSKLYWASFGKLDSLYTENIMTTTATATGTPSPSLISVSVDSTTGFQAGDSITFLNLSTGALEAVGITAITNGTTFTALLRGSFPTGSRVFIDGVNTVLASDHWMPLSLTDAGGFRGNLQASQQRMTGLVDATRGNVSPTARNRAQIWPFMVYDTLSDLKTFDNRGTLRNVYLSSSSASPAPQVGAVITGRDTKQYLVLGTPEHSRYTADTRFFVIGPIN